MVAAAVAGGGGWRRRQQHVRCVGTRWFDCTAQTTDLTSSSLFTAGPRLGSSPTTLLTNRTMRVSSRSAIHTALAATMVSTALLLPEIACSSSKAITAIVGFCWPLPLLSYTWADATGKHTEEERRGRPNKLVLGMLRRDMPRASRLHGTPQQEGARSHTMAGLHALCALKRPADTHISN